MGGEGVPGAGRRPRLKGGARRAARTCLLCTRYPDAPGIPQVGTHFGGPRTPMQTCTVAQRAAEGYGQARPGLDSWGGPRLGPAGRPRLRGPGTWRAAGREAREVRAELGGLVYSNPGNVECGGAPLPASSAQAPPKPRLAGPPASLEPTPRPPERPASALRPGARALQDRGGASGGAWTPRVSLRGPAKGWGDLLVPGTRRVGFGTATPLPPSPLPSPSEPLCPNAGAYAGA